MSLPRINNWFDLVFWIFFCGVALFILWGFVSIIYQSLRVFAEPVRRPPRPAPGTGGSSKKDDSDTWSIGGVSSDTGGVTFGGDSSYSSDTGGSGGGDYGGGDFSGGGGDFGGGGSSGGWND